MFESQPILPYLRCPYNAVEKICFKSFANVSYELHMQLVVGHVIIVIFLCHMCFILRLVHT